MITHGIKEDFKEEKQEKEREKEEKVKEKERENEKVILLKMKDFGQTMNGKDMKMKIGMKSFGSTKMRQHGNPKAGMNGKNMMNMDTSKEKQRKVMDLKIKGKDKVMGKVKQTM